MTAPKPPTVRSVSATLRAAGFAACRVGRDEGYVTEWSQDGVRVSFEAVTNDIYEDALRVIRSVLIRKGWAVQTGYDHLTVTAREDQA